MGHDGDLLQKQLQSVHEHLQLAETPALGQPHANRPVAPKIPTTPTGQKAKLQQGPTHALKVPETSYKANPRKVFNT